MARKEKDRGRFLGTILIASTLAVQVVRYAGAFLTSDMGQVTGQLSLFLSYGMAFTGIAQGVLAVGGAVYLFDGWRRTMPRAGHKWPFRFKVLTGFVFVLFILEMFILVPYVVSRMTNTAMADLMHNTGVWLWAAATVAVPFLTIGGIFTAQQHLVNVTAEVSEAPRKVTGNFPQGGEQTGNLPASFQVARYDWRKLPEKDRARISSMEISEIVSMYGVTPRTARNWRRAGREEAEVENEHERYTE